MATQHADGMYWTGTGPFSGQMVCVLLSVFLANLVLRKVSNVIPASAVGGSPQASLLSTASGCCQAREASKTLGAKESPEASPGADFDPQWQLLF